MLLSILIVTTNCDTDEIEIIENTQVEKSNNLINYISRDKIPNIINLISPNNSSGKNTTAKATEVSNAVGTISVEEILEVIDTLGNVNYSFVVTPKTSKPNSIFNLVVNSKGQTANMAIIEYRMEPSFAEDYYNGIKTFGEFTGSIVTYPFIPESDSDLFNKSNGYCLDDFGAIVNCSERFIIDGVGVDPDDNSTETTNNSGSTGGGTFGTTTSGDTNTSTGGDGGDVTHNYGEPDIGSAGGSGGYYYFDCVTSIRTFELDCVLVLVPYDHESKPSKQLKSKSSSFDCCDGVTIDGVLGVNLTTMAAAKIKYCLQEDGFELSSSQIAYIDALNGKDASILNNFLENENCSADAKEFGKLAIDAYVNSGTVDYVDKIIDKLTGKAKCVYDKLLNSSTGFKNAIKKFEPEFPVAHLKFDMGDIGASKGKTIAPNNNPLTPNSPDFVITIRLNNNSTISGVGKRPNLLVAKTIAHEVIHAEMYRKLLSVLDNGGNIDGVTRQDVLGALDGNYPGMYDYFRRHKNWQHQQMATHYRETLARILQEYDTGITVPNNQQPAQLYMDLSWEGLIYKNGSNTIYTWTSLSQEEKERIEDVISAYINNNSNETCTE